MSRNFVISIVILILITGCSSRKVNIRYPIPREKFVPILIDIHLAYAIQTSPEYRNLVNQYDSISIHSTIFARHHVSKEAFDSTLSFYSRNPKELMELYDEVIMQLNQLQDSLKETGEDH